MVFWQIPASDAHSKTALKTASFFKVMFPSRFAERPILRRIIHAGPSLDGLANCLLLFAHLALRDFEDHRFAVPFFELFHFSEIDHHVQRVQSAEAFAEPVRTAAGLAQQLASHLRAS